MDGIKQVVKIEQDGKYSTLGRLLGYTDQQFYHRRTHYHGLDFTDDEYRRMAERLGVSVEKIKGQIDE